MSQRNLCGHTNKSKPKGDQIQIWNRVKELKFSTLILNKAYFPKSYNPLTLLEVSNGFQSENILPSKGIWKETKIKKCMQLLSLLKIEPYLSKQRRGQCFTNRKIGDVPVKLRPFGEAVCIAPPSSKTAVSSSLTAPLPISTRLTSEFLLVASN